MSEEKPRVEINGVQVAASALAAVSSAVLLSTVGVAGTLIGAAVGSVIVTVGSQIYSYSIRVSRERVVAAQAAAMARMQRVRAGLETRPMDTVDPDSPESSDAQDSEAAAAAADERPAWREALGRLRWKWIAAIAAGVFVIAMVVIVGFELISGESVSTLTGGSDHSGHRTSLGFGSSTKAKSSPTPTPSPSSSSSAKPSSGATSSASSSAGSSSTPTSSSHASGSAGATSSSTPTSSASAGTSTSPGEPTNLPTPTASEVP